MSSSNNPKNIKDIKSFLLKFQDLTQTHYFYLLGIFSTLAVLHLHIIGNHTLESNNIAFYVIYWGGILYLLWQNRYIERTPSSFATYLGLGLLFLVILRPINFWHLDLMLFRFGPVIAGLGLGLISFGFLGLRHYWRLFLLLLLMLSPYGFIHTFFGNQLHFPEVTASISAFLLHYVGFTAAHSGNIVKLPTGQVEVIYPCTGGELIIWLLQIVILIMVVSHITWKQKWGLILSAITVGFFIGCIRVGLLVIVVNNNSLFDYWHGPDGGTVFMAISTIIFAVLCNWILPVDFLSSTQTSTISTPIKPKRLLFLAATWIGIIFTVLYLSVIRKPIGNAIFPEEINLNTWQQVKVESLGQYNAEIPNTGKFILVRSGQDYKYLRNQENLTLQMRYVVNTRGNLNPFSVKLSRELRKKAEDNIKKIEGVGYYLLYHDQQNAYLTACINSRGGSTVNSSQFMTNRYKYDVTLDRMLPWIFGQDVLRDDRCIWTQLSIPLNREIATNVYPVLESVWHENYATWQSLLTRDK
jgi:cyanoexosortase A